MKIFDMVRNVDITGNSGIGNVATVISFDDGTTIIKWDANSNSLHVNSIVVYSSLEDAIKVHGHNGSTIFKERI